VGARWLGLLGRVAACARLQIGGERFVRNIWGISIPKLQRRVHHNPRRLFGFKIPGSTAAGHGYDLAIAGRSGDATQTQTSTLIIGSAVGVIGVVVAGLGVLAGLVALFFHWQSDRRDRERLRVDREARRREREERLSAEYVNGPTGLDAGRYEYRFRLTNTRAEVTSDPMAWLVDDTGARVSDIVLVGGGLIHPGDPIEFSVTVPTLDRPLRLHLGWFDGGTANQERESRVKVPRSEAEAATGWRVSPSQSGEHSNGS
jgi:hypothetical protein